MSELLDRPVLDAAAAIEPRALVPSEREQGRGVARQDYTFVDYREARPPFSVRRAVVEWARAADPRTLDGPGRYLLIVLLASFTYWFDYNAVLNLLPNMQASLGFDLAFIGGFALLLDVLTQIFAPPFGHLADRTKRVWMVRIGFVGAALAFLWLGLAASVAVLVGCRLIGGILSALGNTAVAPLAADWFPSSSRARVYAISGLAATAGRTFGGIGSGVLADNLGWQKAIIIIGVGSIALSSLTFFLREPRRGAADRRELGIDENAPQREQEKLSFAEAFRASASVATVRRMWVIAPLIVLVTAVEGIYLPLYYASHFQVSASGRGLLGTLAAAAGLIGLIFSGPVGDRLIRIRPARAMTLFAIPTLFGALLCVATAYSPWLWLVVGVSLPFNMVSSLLFPMQLTVMSLVIPARIRGLGIQTMAPFQLLGLFFMIVLLPQIIGDDLRLAFLMLIPVNILIAIIYASIAGPIERDMRAARAASAADTDVSRARAEGSNPLVICRDVDVAYDGVQVLFNVDLDVEEGEIVALLGTNGAGKSTLLRAIAGVQQASNGAIFFDGRDITHAPPYENAQRGIVLMPGGHAVFPTLTVEENLRSAAWLHRAEDGYVAAGLARVLEFFPALRSRLDQPAGNLSGGEQQMVGLGQALLMRPRLLMIDELSLGLAPRVVEQLLETLRAIHAEGTTIVLVEQSLNVALTIAERAVFMEKGEVRFSGPTAELLRRPDLIRAVFMGGVGGAGRARGRRRADAELTAAGPLLEVAGVSVAFGGVQALSEVGFEVGDGEIVGIIGPNGAGKTTLFDVVSGFVRPDSGTVRLGAHDLTTLGPDARARLGLARSFQNARLFPSLTVRETIAVALERRTTKSAVEAMVWSPRKRRTERLVNARVDDLVELLRLEGYADKFVGELSTGTRRAVDIACVMAASPKLLLLDEPSSGLAQVETEELGPVLTRVARDASCSILVIEHDLPLVTSVSDRLIAMELGRVVTTGPPQRVMSDERVLASYLSASEDVLARSDSAMVTIAAAVRTAAPSVSIPTQD